MTRKKQINKAAEQFLADRPKGYFHTKAEENTAHTGFVMGAKWADEHPKSPWISVEERLPKDGEMVFTRSVLMIEGGGVRNEEEQYLMQKYTCRWITDKTKQTNMCGVKYDIVDKVTHWMPIPELK